MCSLMRAACQVTGTTGYDLGHEFGRYFITAAVEKGFQKIITGTAGTMAGFLSNINNFVMQLHLSMDLPGYIAPEFRFSLSVAQATKAVSDHIMVTDDLRVEKVTETALELHYWSRKAGLGAWVVGICEAVGETFFASEVVFKLLRGRDDGSCDHEVCSLVCFSPNIFAWEWPR